VEITGQVVVFCWMAQVPGQNVYEKPVMICRVLPLAVPVAGPDWLLELEELEPDEPSSGYSIFFDSK
jgi:hypothetical protein